MYDWKWTKYRAWFLAQAANALCVYCQREGRITPAVVVDHITPHRGNYQLFWETTNHQPLCKTCHDKKTAAGG